MKVKVLYYTILYYTILYYTIVYYTHCIYYLYASMILLYVIICIIYLDCENRPQSSRPARGVRASGASTAALPGRPAARKEVRGMYMHIHIYIICV